MIAGEPEPLVAVLVRAVLALGFVALCFGVMYPMVRALGSILL